MGEPFSRARAFSKTWQASLFQDQGASSQGSRAFPSSPTAQLLREADCCVLFVWCVVCQCVVVTSMLVVVLCMFEIEVVCAVHV